MFEEVVDIPDDAPAEEREEMVKQLCPLTDNLFEVTINELLPFYEKIIKPMLNNPFDYSTPEDWYLAMEQLIIDTSEALNPVGKSIAKNAALLKYYKTYNPFMAFNVKMGFFMTHRPQVWQEGQEEFRYYVKALDGLSYTSALRLIGVFLDDSMLYEPITADVLAARLGSEEPLTRRFDGLLDVLEIVFVNHERMYRLMSDDERILTFDRLLQKENIGETFTFWEKERLETFTKFIETLSHTVKEVARQCYDMESEMIASSASGIRYKTQLVHSLQKVVNLFTIGVIGALGIANAVVEVQETEKATERYVKQLTQTLRN